MTKYFFLLFTVITQAFGQADSTSGHRDSTLARVLIPAYETMATAWDYPRNPFSDSLPSNPHLAEQIKLGFRIFTETPEQASRVTGNAISCNNCHLNAGQKEKAMPLVGISTVYPEYNKRAGRLITLEDRIVECFMRSSNATGKAHGKEDGAGTITAHTKEVLAVSSYLTWLSAGYPVGKKLPWRGQNAIHEDSLLPVNKLDAKHGERLYMEKCMSCHGKDGQGVEIGDKKAGPLWGAKSWNDGAGAARVYTLAGIIRYMMPYLDPGSLSDEEAQHIAAYITSKLRPKFPFKNKDWPTEKIPPDAVYYKRK